SPPPAPRSPPAAPTNRRRRQRRPPPRFGRSPERPGRGGGAPLRRPPQARARLRTAGGRRDLRPRAWPRTREPKRCRAAAPARAPAGRPSGSPHRTRPDLRARLDPAPRRRAGRGAARFHLGPPLALAERRVEEPDPSPRQRHPLGRDDVSLLQVHHRLAVGHVGLPPRRAEEDRPAVGWHGALRGDQDPRLHAPGDTLSRDADLLRRAHRRGQAEPMARRLRQPLLTRPDAPRARPPAPARGRSAAARARGGGGSRPRDPSLMAVMWGLAYATLVAALVVRVRATAAPPPEHVHPLPGEPLWPPRL